MGLIGLHLTSAFGSLTVVTLALLAGFSRSSDVLENHHGLSDVVRMFVFYIISLKSPETAFCCCPCVGVYVSLCRVALMFQ